MINLPNYNPCVEYIEYLACFFSDKINEEKNLKIKYDKKEFITNIKKEDLNEICYNIEFEYYYSVKNHMIIKPDKSFFARNIIKCPDIDQMYVNDLYLQSILKRMYSQIYFGFFRDGALNESEEELCSSIFKSLYTKSKHIKRSNIEFCIEKFNELQKVIYIHKSIIRGIIYAVYDYSNLIYPV